MVAIGFPLAQTCLHIGASVSLSQENNRRGRPPRKMQRPGKCPFSITQTPKVHILLPGTYWRGEGERGHLGHAVGSHTAVPGTNVRLR